MPRQAALKGPAEAEERARHLMDQLALTFQAHPLLQAGNATVAEGFIASRLGERGERSYGTLPRGLDLQALLARADPHTGS